MKPFSRSSATGLINTKSASVRFWLLALGIPMTPWGSTNLGYILVGLATLITIALSASTIWKFSSGIRYEPVDRVHSYSRSENRIRYSLVGSFCLTCLLSIVLVIQLFGGFNRHPPEEFMYIPSWYRVGDKAAIAMVNTAPLVRHRSGFHLLIICLWKNKSPGTPVNDTRIQKTQFFRITGQTHQVEIPLSPEFMAFERPGLDLGIVLLLVPNGVLNLQIVKVSDVTREGGFILSGKAIGVAPLASTPTRVDAG